MNNVEPTITCPNCKSEIKLTESLAAPLVEATRLEFEKKLAARDKEVAKREAAVVNKESELEQAKQNLDSQIAQKLDTERARIADQESKKAKLLLKSEFDHQAKQLTDLQEVIERQDQKLAEAQNAQAEIVRDKRALDEARREIQLTVETKITEATNEIRTKAVREAETGFKLQITEREQQIESMKRTIEDLKRKSEQGSQQAQGEAQELVLEDLLRGQFPHDLIEPVPKGEFGGDVLQHVHGANGQRAGTILWESKRTKKWSDGWLAKLRADQRKAGADIAMLVSQALPQGLETFDLIDGVWVAEFRCIVPVAVAVRHCLIEIASARLSSEGRQTKMEMVYSYLTGSRFRQRIEAIVEKIQDMQADLDRERNAMTRIWAKRQRQIAGVIESTAGLFGDLQGIAGRSMREIEGLNLPMLDPPAADDELE
jgi:hypothetical protein